MFGAAQLPSSSSGDLQSSHQLLYVKTKLPGILPTAAGEVSPFFFIFYKKCWVLFVAIISDNLITSEKTAKAGNVLPLGRRLAVSSMVTCVCRGQKKKSKHRLLGLIGEVGVAERVIDRV